MSNNPYDDLLRDDAGPQPVAANPYDELVLDGQRAGRNALTAASLEVAGVPPEQVASGLDLARDRNVPPAVALGNRDTLEAERQRDRLDRLMRESPTVARWASVPENMGLAQDDLENLSRLDAVASANRQYQQDVPFSTRVSARIQEGWLGLRAAFEGLKTNEAIQRGAEAGEYGDFQMGTDPLGNPIYASEVFLFGDHLEQSVAAAKQGGQAGVVALAEGVAPIQAEMQRLPRRPATAALMEAVSVGDAMKALAIDPLGVIGDLGVTSTVQQLPALAATVATRNPGVAAVAAGGNSGALELGNGVIAFLAQRGVDVTNPDNIVRSLQDDRIAQQAIAFAQTRAGIIGTFDAVSGGLAGKMLIPARVGSRPAREAANTFVAQPVLQMLLGGGGDAAAQYATTGEVRAGQVVAEAAGEIFTAPVEAGAFALDRTFGSTSSAELRERALAKNTPQDQRLAAMLELMTRGERVELPGMETDPAFVGGWFAGEDAERVRRARAYTRFSVIEQSAVDLTRINAITEVAASLKTSERSPEAVEALVRQMREAGQEVPEAVYLDAEQVRTFFQEQGLDPQREMALLAGDATRVSEALATGGDLIVPFERWVSRAAKSPHKDALSRLARFDPERLSAAEMEALDIDGLLAEIYADPARGDAAAARAEDSAVGPEPAQEVYDDVLGQLLGAGVERSAAEAQAQFLAQRYATRAERRGRGESPMDVYRASGLSIEREGLTPASVTQSQPEVDTTLDPVIDAVRTGRLPTDREIYGPSLVSALIAAGGVNPDSVGGTDLISQDAGKRPGLLNRSGMTLDDAVTWAYENGFIEAPTQFLDQYDPDAPDLNSLLELIIDELGGRPTYASRDENVQLGQFRRSAQEISDQLAREGLPIEELTNEQIKAFVLDGIRPPVRRVTLTPDAQTPSVLEVRDRAGELIGQAIVEDEADGLRIRGVELSSDQRGQGLGIEVYQRLFELAQAQGKPLLSDDTEISPDAIRVWDALERRGYTVERGQTAAGVPTFRLTAAPDGVSAAQGDAMGAPRSGERTFNQAEAAPFFSGLVRAVEGVKQAKAPAAQWIGLLQNLPGVRREELEHYDLLGWLNRQTGSVTREQIVEYLRANELVVEETVLGEPTKGSSVDLRDLPFRAAAPTVDGVIRVLGPTGAVMASYGDADQAEQAAYDFSSGYLRSQGTPLPTLAPGFTIQRIDEKDVADFGLDEDSLGRWALFDQSEPDGQKGEIVAETSAGISYAEAIQEVANDVAEMGIDTAVLANAAAVDRPAPYASLTLPGGKNYRVLLLRLPGADSVSSIQEKADALVAEATSLRQQYGIHGGVVAFDLPLDHPARDRLLAIRSSLQDLRDRIDRVDDTDRNFTDGHWQQPNVVAHVRFDERTDADGKRVLFVQEIQSDWHQKGRRHGYRGDGLKQTPSMEVMLRDLDASIVRRSDGPFGDRWVLNFGRGDANVFSEEDAHREVQREWRQAHGERDSTQRVPDAPFKTSWPELVMKRMVRYAAENGFDRVAWPTPDLVPQIEGWGQTLDQIKADPGSLKRFGAIIERYARDLPRIAKDLAKRLGGKLVATKIDTGGKADVIEAPPNFAPMTEDDRVGFGGAEDFADGSAPVMAQTRVLVDGKPQEVYFILAADGVDVQWFDDEGPSEPEHMEWDGFGLMPPESAAFAQVLFNELWKNPPNQDGSASLWDPWWGVELKPIPKASLDLPAIEITPQMRAAVMGGQTLFQRGGGGRKPVDVQRGRIEFRTDGGARIVLTKDANLSTFLHETGHLWLEELVADATGEDANPELAADLDKVLAWMGVDARAADGRDAVLKAIGTEQHESWARGFEAFLREGRAPTPALRDIFARFRAWLVRLYRDVTQLRVELSPEVRAVMARLIATDEEIAAAEGEQSYGPLAGSEAEARELGMSPDEFRDYATARERATAEAREEVEQSLLAAWEREAKAEYQAELQRMREAVEEEVNAEPVYRAMLELQGRDGPKLDKAELVDRYGAAFLARLPGPGSDRANRGGYLYTLQGGLGLDEAGFLFGFNSGDALVQALVNARPRKDVIEALARERMAQFYPDPLLDGSLQQRAQQAVHSSARADVLVRELRVLARQAGVAPTQARVLAEVARRVVGRRSVRELRPREFLVAERRAAREAMAAVAERQFPVAHRAKFRQALNARLYAEATAAQERVEKARRYLSRFDKKSTREKLGKAGNGYLEQIEVILDQLDLRRISGAEIDRNAALRQMAEAIADGRLVVPPEVMRRVEASRRTNWRELTVDELGAMVDAVRQIETLARRELEIVLDGERRQLEEDALEVADSVLLNGSFSTPNLGTKSGREKVAKWGREALAVWLRPSEIARQADGGKARGAVTRRLIEPIRRAVTEKLEPMKAKAREDLAALYSQFYTKRELVGMARHRMALPEIGQHWTRLDLLSLALNWGNDGNRQAVLESVANGRRMFTEDGVKAALARLTERDWQFVQAVWDYVDTYWPAIAEAQRRRTGLAPEKVEAAPVVVRTADGKDLELRGGYYPLVYDRDSDANTKLDELQDAFQRIMNGRNAKAATARGHTIERVGSGKRPVRFGINVLHSHLDQVIHDLALGDAVDYVYKVLNFGNVKAAFSETGKLEDWKALNIWLKDAAAGELGARNALDQAFRWIRVGFTKSKLGFNIITALLQPTGILQSAVVVGKANMLAGLTQFLASPVASYRQVMEASSFMRTRYVLNAWNKDVQDSMDALRGRLGIVPSWVGPAMFLMMAQSQKVVDVSTWLAAYRKELASSGSHDDAVWYADGVVENAQTSGFFSDRSAFERGSLSDTTRQVEFVRAWSTLISYMLAKGNIAYGRVRSTNFRSIPAIASLAADLGLLFTAEAMLAALIRGTWPDDDEDWWWWAAKETAATGASTIPFVRDVASAARGFDVTGGPQGGLLNDIGATMTQIQQGEVDAALIKSANNVGGTLFHYPSAQMNRAIDAYWREEVEGEEVAPYEYLTGRRDRQ